ncbi:hypothetical protein F5883DRAFT_127838 [Diaporthe sp. PMI_573]|nr:hypothetical protein F5883DRAFT_127838 [Diaporthaceae sp. PMI_573]
MVIYRTLVQESEVSATNYRAMNSTVALPAVLSSLPSRPFRSNSLSFMYATSISSPIPNHGIIGFQIEFTICPCDRPSLSTSRKVVSDYTYKVTSANCTRRSLQMTAPHSSKHLCSRVCTMCVSVMTIHHDLRASVVAVADSVEMVQLPRRCSTQADLCPCSSDVIP